MAHHKNMLLPLDEVIRRYQSGETAQALAAECGVTYHTVQSRLRSAGISIRGRGPTAAGKLRISQALRHPLDEEQLRRLAAQGLSAREIAALLNGSPSEECVRERMVSLGLPRLPAKARPERNAFWGGGLSVDKQGYILVHRPGYPGATERGYVREHRLVMERVLERKLLAGEVVDHRNGDTSDNRPENLRLFASNAEHLAATLRGHHKLPAAEREKLRREAVQRARRRVEARLRESGSGAGR